MNDVVIQVEALSKQYRLGEVSTGSLHHDINRWWHRIRGLPDPYLSVTGDNIRTRRKEANAEKLKNGNTEISASSEKCDSISAFQHFSISASSSDYVWALRDINFEVRKGEVLGIIGRNGAGKSTLLKILSRITAPTLGEVRIKGRVASLLEIGTGFHQDLTGRENIFMNGAILGMTKYEIRSKLDEIVEFSGCARYIDTPVKRYSSGMVVRLGFAVAAHLDPEILIVDEVLAVGDAEFQAKCIGKMQDVATHGRTVLFVSHNMAAVQKLCPQSLVLDEGKLVYGPVASPDAVGHYRRTRTLSGSDPVRFQRGGFRLDGFKITDSEGRDASQPVPHDEPHYVEVAFHLEGYTKAFNIGYVLYDQDGEVVYVTLSTDSDAADWPPIVNGSNRLRSVIPAYCLNAGDYQLALLVSFHCEGWIAHPDKDNIRIPLSVCMGPGRSPYWHTRRSGVLAPLHRWERIEEAP